jgi:single-strand DNA-binding protein
MINKVTLVGNLGKDPELKTLESGATVAQFSVATNENYKDKNGEWQTITEWHNVVVWREQADRAAGQLKKGHMVFVEGKITNRKYQAADGTDRYVTDIVASMWRSLEKREKSDYVDMRIPSEEPASMAARSNGGGGATTTAVNEPRPDMPDGGDLPF